MAGPADPAWIVKLQSDAVGDPSTDKLLCARACLGQPFGANFRHKERLYVRCCTEQALLVNVDRYEIGDQISRSTAEVGSVQKGLLVAGLSFAYCLTSGSYVYVKLH